MRWIIPLVCCLLVSFSGFVWGSSYDDIPLKEAPINPYDQASLQRGAKMYINYCSGCHTLNFMRYNRLAKDIGIVDENGQVDEQLVKDNLIFTGGRITDTLQVAMRKNDAKEWFGVVPPDLSVIARARGVDWLYTYLLSFYQDNSRPLGVNNLLFNETAMPDVLVNLRGRQIPLYQEQTITMDGKPQVVRSISDLVLIKDGMMTAHQFEMAVADLVNFLDYVGEPSRAQRYELGPWVIGYLILFALIAFLLKKTYWSKLKRK